MKRSKFSTAQKAKILAEHDGGKSVTDLCRQYQISAATLYKWKKDYEDSQDEDKRRIKELEAENVRLKKMYANLSIDHEILQEGYAMVKKFQAQKNKK
ncbi:transposase [Aureispira anguillae]|uniref:Transposase n=1 Tax=Aureispira anguillae TaxID=2864201 RepID=A0A916DS28_9BACT|nr:transposase [Aureispira anguillae]BDS09565.1 transposase [Aureispira anguillae]BDS10975.1 transposase [Aureispira anguillae]BDS11481.1 transposase [Aureispira anguillae]BDS15662.1 transposase [Aureispira anguillae]